jgi:hypothetical protein
MSLRVVCRSIARLRLRKTIWASFPRRKRGVVYHSRESDGSAEPLFPAVSRCFRAYHRVSPCIAVSQSMSLEYQRCIVAGALQEHGVSRVFRAVRGVSCCFGVLVHGRRHADYHGRAVQVTSCVPRRRHPTTTARTTVRQLRVPRGPHLPAVPRAFRVPRVCHAFTVCGPLVDQMCTALEHHRGQRPRLHRLQAGSDNRKP